MIDEYIDITPQINTVPVASIESTSSESVEIGLVSKSASGDILPPAYPYTLSIYDDISNTLIESGITVPTSTWILPQKYKQAVGVYRISAVDSLGRIGDSTLGVRSGPVARLEFRPISTTLALGATSL